MPPAALACPASLPATSADLRAMLTYLRDAPTEHIGVHVLGRPDITGARVQAGIRVLLASCSTPAPVTPATLPERAPPRPKRAGPPPGSAGALLAAVKRVTRAADRRGNTPILGCVRLTVRDGVATFQATDMDRAITESLPWPGAPDCDVAVNARRLADTLRVIPAAEFVSLAIDLDGKSARVGPASLALADVTDFLSLTAGDMPACWSMPAADLRAMLATVQHAISTEETRYYLNGVFLHVSDGVLRAVATEGHQLAWCDRPLPDGAAGMPPHGRDGGPPGVIVPRDAVADLLALLPEAGNVAIRVSASWFEVLAGSVLLFMKLIDGTFPEYSRVIPRHTGRAVFRTADLVAAARAAGAVSDQRSQSVCLDLTPGASEASGVNYEGASVTVPLPLVSGGARGFTVDAQVRYLLAVLERVGETVEMRFDPKHPEAPMTWHDPADSSVLFVIMPMRV